jgi:hypothetical protein
VSGGCAPWCGYDDPHDGPCKAERVSPPFPLDADGDCRACGHAVWLHTPEGCHERVHGAALEETTCDCRLVNPSLDGFDGAGGAS